MEGEKVRMKRFDKDFKLSAVKMVIQEGHSVAEVARSLGIHTNMLYNWKKSMATMEKKPFLVKDI
ncbi:MAG: transposase [Candidatus Omnitrophota bacterium]|jgi:transposase